MTLPVLLVSVALLQGPGDTVPELKTLTDRAEAAFAAGDLETSVLLQRERRERARQLRDPSAEAWSVTRIAYYARRLGDYDVMLDAAQEAVRLYETAEPADEGWLTLGLAYEALNAPRDAAQAYDRAHGIQTSHPSGMWRDRSGQMWEKAGEFSTALARYEDAVRLDEAKGILNGQLRSRARAAALYTDAGDPLRAREHLARIHELVAGSGKPAGPMILQLLGIAYEKLGDKRAAVEYLDQAFAAIQRNADATLDNLRNIAQAFAKVSAPERAITAFSEAITIADRGDLPLQQARLRAFRAAAERDAGRLAEARADLEWALPVFESVRATVTRPRLRTEYFGTLYRHYELYVDVLVRLGQSRSAFEANDRARARLLTEVLATSGVDLRVSVSPELRRQEAALKKRLTTLGERYQASASLGRGSAARQALATELREAERQFDDLQARIRAATPAPAETLLNPPSAPLSTIQQHLGNDTVLLEYALGETRSYLFVVSNQTFSTIELPGREAIQAAARRVHSAFSSRPQHARPSISATNDGRTLANVVLREARPLLQGKRLAIVADGSLQYVPFHALPGLAGAEIVYLPSASFLVLQRETASERTPGSKSALVLADPVFSRDDPRLGRMAAPARADDRAATALPRLLFSRREGQAVAEAFAGTPVVIVTDFRASKAVATSPDIVNYRVVHIASHGLVDTATGTTSALILSQLDENGRARDGRLGLHDIYTLRLSADLVVLSACDTALGRDVRGEGLVGLTRGFMHAGARRVIASLWKVDDAATSELMRAFYTAFVSGRMQPAAALRRAQAHVSSQPGWSHPYFWAGFQLHGDWR